MLGQPFFNEDMLEDLQLKDVPESFDEKQYAENQPEAASFKLTFCKLNNIPDRVRLYCHFLSKQKSFDFSVVRSLFTTKKYEACYAQLVTDLPRILREPYYPLGYWLVSSAKNIENSLDLIARLEDQQKTTTCKKCLNAVLTAIGKKPTVAKSIIFYACNYSYFEAFKVSITSLVNSNSVILENLLIVIGYDNTFEFDILASFMAALGNVAYELVDMSPYRSLQLKEEYGTQSEHILDMSAYYRIFLLKQLVDKYKGRYTKALYLDADTLVIGDIEPLLTSKQRLPVLACFENATDEQVKKTKAVNDVDCYFNSGVMLFDLEHPQLVNCIDKAIDAAMNHTDKLMFQDQCALNIGFNRCVDRLDDIYNFMLHSKLVLELNKEIVIFHFTGRLKPWNVEYQANSSFNCIWRLLHGLLQAARSNDE